jgi:hypothetical protein
MRGAVEFRQAFHGSAVTGASNLHPKKSLTFWGPRASSPSVEIPENVSTVGIWFWQ